MLDQIPIKLLCCLSISKNKKQPPKKKIHYELKHLFFRFSSLLTLSLVIHSSKKIKKNKQINK